MGLMANLGGARVGIDTALLIYFIEEHARYLPLVEPLFQAAAQGAHELIASELVLLEVLVVPYRAGKDTLARRYEEFLTRSRGLQLIGLTRDLLRAAARLRAATGIRTPDALHLSAARSAGCAAFITNDRRLPAIPGLRILQLSDYIA